MSQFFRSIFRPNLKVKEEKKLSIENDEVKITGKKEEVNNNELNLDSIGAGGKDANYNSTSKSYNLFLVSDDLGTSLVASPNLKPDGFDKQSLVGKVLVNPNTEEIINIKYDYSTDNSIKNVLDLTNTDFVDPSTSLSRLSINNWSLNYTGSTNLSWTSLTYGNGIFVAVANSGTGNRVMTSPDGSVWTSRSSASNNNWTSVTFGNNLFVAVSNSGTGNRVMTSPDGVTWTSRTSASDNNWTSVTFGNNLFVAVSNSGTGNRVMTSSNGVTWTSRTSASNNNWTSVTYGNGLFVAVANSGTGNRVMTSTDGITWTSRTSAFDSSWSSVTYGGNKFVAIASNSSNLGKRIMYSLNGINWNLGSINSSLSNQSIVDGSDGALVVNNGQNFQIPEGSVKKYSSITINSGGILEITGNDGGWTEIGCSGNCVINGQIIVRAGKSGTATHSSKTFTKNSVFNLGSISYSISQKAGGEGTSGGSINWSYSYRSGFRTRIGSRTIGGGAGGKSWLGGGGGGGGCGGRISNSEGINGGWGSFYLVNQIENQVSINVSSVDLDLYGSSSGSNLTRLTYTYARNPNEGSGGRGGGLEHGLSGEGKRGGDGYQGGGGGGGKTSYTSHVGTGGGGGGYKGHHGKGLVLFVEGSISGSGVVDASGNNGFNGGSGIANASQVLSGRGGGGAGGSGGRVIVRHSGGTVPTINVAGGKGGSGGSVGNGTAQNGQDGNSGSFETINIAADPSENAWSSISYGSNYFVGVASSGSGTRLITSVDGITWELSNIKYYNSWTSICFGKSNFTVVSSDAPKSGYQAMANLKF